MKGGLVWFGDCSVLSLRFLIETSGEGDLESGEESIALNQETRQKESQHRTASLGITNTVECLVEACQQ